ncbi:MAG: rhodanese-like domain-containing protein [Polyangiaceae bacterium]
MSYRSFIPFIAIMISSGVGCASSPSVPPPTSPPASSAASSPPVVVASAPSGRIDGAAAHRLVADGATLVDVRSPEEFEAGHIEGATNVPIDELGAHDFGRNNAPLVLYCAHGPRSERGGEMLRKSGRTQVYVLGPMSSWDDAKKP